MDIKEIKKIVEMMTQNDLSEFLLENEECTLQLKRGSTVAVQPVVSHAVSAPVVPAAVPAAVPAQDAASAKGIPDGLVEIPSPMVGTFYRSPSPEADSFVDVGDEVSTSTVVCIIEAMKVMNEIQADVKGRIRKVLVDNATPVQFGQPLFLVEPA